MAAAVIAATAASRRKRRAAPPRSTDFDDAADTLLHLRDDGDRLSRSSSKRKLRRGSSLHLIRSAAEAFATAGLSPEASPAAAATKTQPPSTPGSRKWAMLRSKANAGTLVAAAARGDSPDQSVEGSPLLIASPDPPGGHSSAYGSLPDGPARSQPRGLAQRCTCNGRGVLAPLSSFELCCRCCNAPCREGCCTISMRDINGALWRSLLLTANAIASGAVATLLLEVSWDEDRREFLEDHGPSLVLQWVIVGLTIAMQAQLVEFYWHLYSVKLAAIEDERRRGGPRLTKPLKWWLLPVEMAVCVLMPLPSGALGLSEKAALLVFLRLYHIVRVAHRSSLIYRLRPHILAVSGSSVGAATRSSVARVQFDVLLSIKSLFTSQPVVFISVVLAATYLPLALGVYVQERDADDSDYWTLSTSLYYIAAVMSTVGADAEPRNPWARLLTLAAFFVGVTLTSLAVVVISRTLELSDAESLVYEMATSFQSRIRAARRRADGQAAKAAAETAGASGVPPGSLRAPHGSAAGGARPDAKAVYDGRRARQAPGGGNGATAGLGSAFVFSRQATAGSATDAATRDAGGARPPAPSRRPLAVAPPREATSSSSDACDGDGDGQAPPEGAVVVRRARSTDTGRACAGAGPGAPSPPSQSRWASALAARRSLAAAADGSDSDDADADVTAVELQGAGLVSLWSSGEDEGPGRAGTTVAVGRSLTPRAGPGRAQRVRFPSSGSTGFERRAGDHGGRGSPQPSRGSPRGGPAGVGRDAASRVFGRAGDAARGTALGREERAPSSTAAGGGPASSTGETPDGGEIVPFDLPARLMMRTVVERLDELEAMHVESASAIRRAVRRLDSLGRQVQGMAEDATASAAQLQDGLRAVSRGVSSGLGELLAAVERSQEVSRDSPRRPPQGAGDVSDAV